MAILTTRNGEKFIAGDYNSNDFFSHGFCSKIYKINELAIDKVTDIFTATDPFTVDEFQYRGNAIAGIRDRQYRMGYSNHLPLYCSVSEFSSLKAVFGCSHVVQPYSRKTEPIFTVSSKYSDRFTISSIIRMEYIPGETAGKLHRENKIEPRDFLVILRDIAQALIEIGKAGVIHRDVKPHNIMYHAENREATLIDFNVAIPPAWSIASLPEDLQILLQERMENDYGIVLGTIPYQSPEQARSEELTSATDYFSLGITAAHLMFNEYAGRDDSDQMLNRKEEFLNRVPALFDLSEYKQLLTIIKQQAKTNDWQLKETLEGLESVLHPEPKQRDIAFLKECTIADLRKRS